MDDNLQLQELAARRMAHGCPVCATKDEPDMLYKATRSAATSAACGDRWLAARRNLKAAGLDPLPLDHRGVA